MSRKSCYVFLAVLVSVLIAATCWRQSWSQTTPQDTQRAFHWPEGKRVAVSLSFDDARPSQVDTALDIITPTGVKATFYVNPPAVRKRLDGWKRAVASGHEIGNHSISHPCTGNFPWSLHNALEDYTLEKMSQQLDDADAQIQELLGVHAVTFGYPCGQKFVGRGPELKSYVPLIGQKFLVGRGYMDEYFNDPLFCDLAQASGTAIDGMDYIYMVKQILAATKQGGWVIFVSHEVGDQAFQVTDTRALLALCKYVQDPGNGVFVDTVEHIGKYVIQQRATLPK